jgi:tRNA(Arg) A34 adenosine deaminase TadA
MFGFHLACLLTKYLERTAGKPTAILYDPVTRSILGWSRDTRANPFDLGTAAVNLQRGCGARVSRCQILTSTPPEVVCLGMAVLTGVTDIIHFDGVNAVRYAPGNDLLSAPYRGPLEPEYPPKVGEWLNECSRFLTTRDVEGFETEFANVPAGSRMPSDIQNLIVGGETEPENVFPPRPAAAGGALLNGRNPAVDSFWMSLARRLVGAVHTGANLVAPGMRRGHNIGCILVDLNNRVLAWGVNTLNNNPTYHAETKCMWMFQRYYPGEQVPIGATLYTTLQSCLMCSATIKHACGDHAVRVVYADLDKTPPSVLTRGGGAREESLSSILRAEYSRLLAQHLLLARARWDRLRSAYKTDLFDRARRAPERAVIESDIRRIDALQDPR